MKKYSMTHLSDGLLDRDLKATAGQDRVTTAKLLAQMAEYDSRRLYVPAGYASMHLCCIQELRFSEDETYKRIRVARTAAKHPDVFPMIEDGRLTLSAVVLLTPALTARNAVGLLAAAANMTNRKIELLLAQQFPKEDVETALEAIPDRNRNRRPRAPGSSLSRRNASRFRSRVSRRRTTCFAKRRRCQGTRFHRATSISCCGSRSVISCRNCAGASSARSHARGL